MNFLLSVFTMIPYSFVTLSLSGGELLKSIGKTDTAADGAQMIEKTLKDGSAKSTFIEMICSQGVDKEDAHSLCKKDGDHFSVLPQAKWTTEIQSSQTGSSHQIFLRMNNHSHCFLWMIK